MLQSGSGHNLDREKKNHF